MATIVMCDLEMNPEPEKKKMLEKIENFTEVCRLCGASLH